MLASAPTALPKTVSARSELSAASATVNAEAAAVDAADVGVIATIAENAAKLPQIATTSSAQNEATTTKCEHLARMAEIAVGASAQVSAANAVNVVRTPMAIHKPMPVKSMQRH
jgi:hypothetical protein